MIWVESEHDSDASATLVEDSATAELDDDLDTSEVLGEVKFDVESFLEELERRLLHGHSRHRIKIWAASNYGVDRETTYRLVEFVRQSWAKEFQSSVASTERRDQVRAMYMEIYRTAMERKRGDHDDPDLPIALKTVEALSKLDMLLAPDINVTVNNTTVTTGQTRARVTELIDLMRFRAARRTKVIEESMAEKQIINAQSVEKPKNGTNR